MHYTDTLLHIVTPYLEDADVEDGHGEEVEDVEEEDGTHCCTL